MSMPFYASAEQIMRDRSEYARKGIARGRSVVVTINDRGPFVRGRVLDLSTGAARAIGLTSAGVGRVTAEVVS